MFLASFKKSYSVQNFVFTTLTSLDKTHRIFYKVSLLPHKTLAYFLKVMLKPPALF